MGSINIEIPEDIHDRLRFEKGRTNTPIKYLIQDALDEQLPELPEDEEAESDAE